jgi:hypothetical protein
MIIFEVRITLALGRPSPVSVTTFPSTAPVTRDWIKKPEQEEQ